MRLFFLIILISAFILPSEAEAQRKRKRKKTRPLPFSAPLILNFDESPVFSKSFTGFALYDPAEGKMLHEYNSDKYFTPASNTKILTLFTGSIIIESEFVFKFSPADIIIFLQ